MHDLCPSITWYSGRRLGLLSSVALGAVFAAGQPADAVTITPVFETSWTGAPAAATTAVLNVINEYQNTFSNPVNITVQFGWGDNNGTPVTSGATGGPVGLSSFTLAQTEALYANAVSLQPTNAALATAGAHLPATYTNPAGSSNFGIGNAEYKALTGTSLPGYTGIDSSTGFATNLCSGTTCPSGFTALVEHEVAHAMGRVDYAFVGTPFLTPLDFFKYDPGTSNLDPLFVQTSFSIDGGATNPLGRTFSNTSDSGDWIGVTSDSYNYLVANGATVSTADITEMCALGWNDCSQAVPAPLIGFGLPAFLVVGGLLFGAKLLERSKNKGAVNLGPRGWLSLGT
jgi:hypothetical protein